MALSCKCKMTTPYLRSKQAGYHTNVPLKNENGHLQESKKEATHEIMSPVFKAISTRTTVLLQFDKRALSDVLETVCGRYLGICIDCFIVLVDNF